jgi:hypothetical protein
VTVGQVWNKAQAVPGYDPSVYRKDSCGAWIAHTDYGQLSTYGWEIDHIIPVAKSGTDAPSNLPPLHWKNNRHRGDTYPNWTCAVTA